MQKLCLLHKRLLNSFSTSWVKNRCLKIAVIKWYRLRLLSSLIIETCHKKIDVMCIVL